MLQEYFNNGEFLDLFISTIKGGEQALYEEVIQVANFYNLTFVTKPYIWGNGVKLKANFDTLFGLIYSLHTASKVLLILGEYTVKDMNDVYCSIKKIKWHQCFSVHKTFAVNSALSSYIFNNSMQVSLKVKDAIADYFREKMSERPNVNKENPDIPIFVRIFDDIMTVCLDMTNFPISNRAYKTAHVEAPIRENLAAIMLTYTKWPVLMNAIYEEADPQFIEFGKEKKQLLVPFFADSMCGGGTLIIEALLMSLHKKIIDNKNNLTIFNLINSSKLQDNSNKIKTLILNKALSFEMYKEKVNKYMIKAKKYSLIENYDENYVFNNSLFYGSDVCLKSIKAFKQNMLNLGINEYINLEHTSFDMLNLPNYGGILLQNPPYGERLEDEEKAKILYKQLGDFWKHNAKNWQTWLIAPANLAIKNIGLKPSWKYKLYNGSIECSLSGYSIF